MTMATYRYFSDPNTSCKYSSAPYSTYKHSAEVECLSYNIFVEI